MEILLIAFAAVLSVYVVSRFTGGATEAMLKHYEVFAKRFGLEQKTAHSKWGAGIGEHYSLKGDYNGYPVSLYDHFVKVGRLKRRWTTLTFEALFVEEREFVLETKSSQEGARFEKKEGFEAVRLNATLDEMYSFHANDPALATVLVEEGLGYRLENFAKNESMGSFRLSKGFLEYRETKRMTKEAQRVRFQQAIVLLGDLADGLSARFGRG